LVGIFSESGALASQEIILADASVVDNLSLT
jgi:hypothetical protein